jgi:hypothetical protein
MPWRIELQPLRQLTSADADYRFGQPTTYLSPQQLARLLLLRSRLGDTPGERAAEGLSAPSSPD